MPGILRTLARVANRQDRRPPGDREQPECIVLAVREDLTPSPQPPVRIFVGTEPAQSRAERVFIWSVEQARDPSRVYEIYLMADLVGFNRHQWLTGFTNYRFAIPHFTGGHGRAIYNDVDQIYLSDPAELFDLEMGDHGFLSITPGDTSVMLIDCARMAGVWPLDLVRRRRRKRIEAHTRAMGELWAPLQPEWNARDEEYVAGRSKVLHYTTIHAQPWQPFPERFVYQRNPVGYVWQEMERAADEANYQIFTAQRPSTRYHEMITALRKARRADSNGARPHASAAVAADESIDAWLADEGADSAVAYQLGAGSDAHIGGGSAGTVTRFDPVRASVAVPAESAFDAVLCDADIQYLPQEDLPWVLDSLFRCARRCLHLSLTGAPSPLRLADGTMLRYRPRSYEWWLRQIETTSAHHPEVRWRLVGREQGRELSVREGGWRADGQPPTVWVLADHKAGHATQSIGLADAVGVPYEVKALRFNVLNHLSNRIRRATTIGLDRRRSAPLQAPWPDLVISTGRRTAPVARWIGRQSGGRTRLVQLGRRGGESVGAFDLVVACEHFRLPLHPRRMELVAPLNAVTPERLAQAAERWRGLFDGAAHPHVVLVVGGASARHRLDAETARRMAEEVSAFAGAAGGSVFAITSPRTGADAIAAVRVGLGESGHLHEWKAGQRDNPYLGYLALADAIVVTGESESMLAEAAAVGAPLFIYPLPERPLGFRRLSEWVATRAEAQPRNRRGAVRPQLGLEYLCARLVEAGIVRPPRHLDQYHRGLIRAGAARYFGASLEGAPRHPLREADAVARRVRQLLGIEVAIEGHPEVPRRWDQQAHEVHTAVPELYRDERDTQPAEELRPSTHHGAHRGLSPAAERPMPVGSLSMQRRGSG